jgi:hypothetical protein
MRQRALRMWLVALFLSGVCFGVWMPLVRATLARKPLHAQEGYLVKRDRCRCWVEPDGTWVCGEMP